ncbi:MAG: hypothetical protein AB1589_24980 [Cyanobacteriota bacterium]
MTTSLMNLTNGNGKKYDDLTKIRGIEAAKQQWLRESLKVYTFRDLARLSVDKIESRIKAEWHSISRKEIKGWIAQARELATTGLALQQFVEFLDLETKPASSLATQQNESSQPTVEAVEEETELPSSVTAQKSELSQPIVEVTQAESDAFCYLPSVQSESSQMTVESVNAEAGTQLRSNIIDREDKGGKEGEGDKEDKGDKEEKVRCTNATSDEISSSPSTVESESSQLIVESTEIETDELSPHPLLESESSQLLAQSTEAEVSSQLSFVESESSQVIAASTEAEGNLLPVTGEEEWQSLASFKVEFQSRKIAGQVEEQKTIIHFVEADTVQSWSGIDMQQLQGWILERLTEEMQPELEMENPATTSPIAAVEITQIRAFQPTQTDTPMVVENANRLFPDIISSAESFALEVDFSLAEVAERDMPRKRMRYYIQVYARDRSTGAIAYLGETEPRPLIKRQTSYTAQLAQITLEPGMYRLQVLVKFQGAPTTLGYFKVPLLQVV